MGVNIDPRPSIIEWGANFGTSQSNRSSISGNTQYKDTGICSAAMYQRPEILIAIVAERVNHSKTDSTGEVVLLKQWLV
jgi:hypothetical protein